MTSQTISRPFQPAPRFELGPLQRAMVTIVGVGLTSLALFALIRAGAFDCGGGGLGMRGHALVHNAFPASRQRWDCMPRPSIFIRAACCEGVAAASCETIPRSAIGQAPGWADLLP